jgi:hypothetical protein
MSRLPRSALIILGLMVVCFSLAILVYTLWPIETIDVQGTIEPTLFVVP